MSKLYSQETHSHLRADESGETIPFTQSIKAAINAQKEGKFYSYIDPALIRKRIEEVSDKYPEIKAAIVVAEEGLAEEEQVTKYRNPKDVIAFCIAQVLCVSEKKTLNGGEFFYTSSPNYQNFNPMIKRRCDHLYKALAAIHKSNTFDIGISMALAENHYDSGDPSQQVLAANIVIGLYSKHPHPQVMYILGKYMYHMAGRGQFLLKGGDTKKQQEDGFMLLKDAAGHGHTQALFTLAEEKKERVLLRQAVELGDADAQLKCGIYLSEATSPSITKGRFLEEAAKNYLNAANQGHSEAQFMLGGCYERGDGVELNLETAAACYALAAIQGNIGADKALEAILDRTEITDFRRPPSPRIGGTRVAAAPMAAASVMDSAARN
jgi:TPR repeat protein